MSERQRMMDNEMHFEQRIKELDAQNAKLVAVCKLAIANEAKADSLRGSGVVDHVDIRALRAVAQAARLALVGVKG